MCSCVQEGAVEMSSDQITFVTDSLSSSADTTGPVKARSFVSAELTVMDLLVDMSLLVSRCSGSVIESSSESGSVSSQGVRYVLHTSHKLSFSLLAARRQGPPSMKNQALAAPQSTLLLRCSIKLKTAGTLYVPEVHRSMLAVRTLPGRAICPQKSQREQPIQAKFKAVALR
eukprot:TRINITY_DN20042_c1_g1_i1.p4 TRINITY_DN20042_c1_g1~~TRINITY_DN20042_c1_g1_i1.p4  ORF type:complete len:172 (-),score=31.80 TRINITY_DN20042_c1_g1_i1:2277-2792(-)